MELDQTEEKSGLTWLFCAGGAAVILSFCLWRADEYISDAPARDRAHNAEMRELRTAQASLPARVTDPRQTLTLTIEKVAAKQKQEKVGSPQ